MNFIMQLIENYHTLVAHMATVPTDMYAEPALAFWQMALPMIGMGAMGYMKNKKAQAQEESDRKLASETQRYSWITGEKAQPIQRAGSMWGDVAQGTLSGAMFGQGLESASAANKLQDTQTKVWDEILKQKQNQPSLYGGVGSMGGGNSLLGVNTRLPY